MIGRLQCVVLDCPEPLSLAGFYRELVGGEVNRADPRWSLHDDWATLHLDDGRVLAFQRVESHRPPRWPDPEAPQQFHLDVGVADLARACDAAVALGATVLDEGGPSRGWTVCADPAGHPFCLVRE
ncbi:VOC family protein [Streptomyces coeruleoprunus]|uniref:VOC family protein n=1 Tax=Streptomyces coeruleoprunus TaxID=285563 RepID=A0ABV9XF47_9ACTN